MVSPVDLVPGLWVGVLALLLLRALRRWYDPVPGPVAAVFAVALLILFGPVLFGGKLLLPLDNLRGQVPFKTLAPTVPHGNILQGDLIELVEPSIAEGRALWGAGRWPLWNARTGAGMPLLADPQAQALQPLVLLASVVPWERAAAVTAALRVLCALVFTFLWIRAQGLADGPALAGAFAFGLGGFVLLWVGWPIANAAALLPAVLYAVARVRGASEGVSKAAPLEPHPPDPPLPSPSQPPGEGGMASRDRCRKRWAAAPLSRRMGGRWERGRG